MLACVDILDMGGVYRLATFLMLDEIHLQIMLIRCRALGW
jgi:hypothetical protein